MQTLFPSALLQSGLGRRSAVCTLPASCQSSCSSRDQEIFGGTLLGRLTIFNHPMDHELPTSTLSAGSALRPTPVTRALCVLLALPRISASALTQAVRTLARTPPRSRRSEAAQRCR